MPARSAPRARHRSRCRRSPATAICTCSAIRRAIPTAIPIHKSREASFEDALKMHRGVGLARGVFVQPANYMTDHTYLKEALARVPRVNYRATGIIDETVSDAELARLNEAGMRGVRFNF